MIRVPPLCLALLALASPSRAATLIACEDADNQPQTVSVANPCPVTISGGGGGTPTGTAGTPNAAVVSVQGIAGGTSLPVTQTGATSNASSAVATSSTNSATDAWLYGYNGTTWDQLQVDGSKNLKTTATGTGTAGSAAAGVVTVQGIASMTKLLVTPDSVALPANQSTNESQINGVTPLMGNGVSGTGSQRVNIASDNTAFSVNVGTVTALPALVAGAALIGKVGVDQTTPGTTNAVSLAQVGANTVLTGNGVSGTGSQRVNIASDNTAFPVTAALSATMTNPTSTLTMTATTTAYTAGQLIASSATAGGVVVPSFAIATSAGSAVIPRLRLRNNDTTSTSWVSQTVQVDLWSAAPTFTNGDRAAFLTATGTASHLGAFTCTTSTIQGDGTYAECYPNVGNWVQVTLGSGTSIFWTLNALTGSGVTGASKVWTITAEVMN